jgi:hypothetical protein
MESSKERIEAQICAYVDGELTGDEKAEIERHLTSNPQHRALIAELMQHKALLQELPRATVPGDLNEGLTGQLERHSLLGDDAERPIRASIFRIHRWPQFASIAAVIILAVGLGLVVTYVLPPSRNRNVAVNDGGRPASSPGVPGAFGDGTGLATRELKDVTVRGRDRETELRLSKSDADSSGTEGAVAERMKQVQSELDSSRGATIGQEARIPTAGAQLSLKPADDYSLYSAGNAGAVDQLGAGKTGAGLYYTAPAGPSVTLGTVVGLQQTRQLLEHGAQLTTNFRENKFAGAKVDAWRRGGEKGTTEAKVAQRSVDQNAAGDQRSRLVVPADVASNVNAPALNATTNDAMVCLVVSTDSPAAVNGQLGGYLRDNNIRYAFTELNEAKLLGEQVLARGGGGTGAAGGAGASPTLRARITVNEYARGLSVGRPTSEFFKESESPARGENDGAARADAADTQRAQTPTFRGGSGGAAGGASTGDGAGAPPTASTPATTSPPMPAPAQTPAAGATVVKRQNLDRAENVPQAKVGEPVAGQDLAKRLEPATQAQTQGQTRTSRTEDELLAAKPESAAKTAVPAQQHAGKPGDADVDAKKENAWSFGGAFGTQTQPADKKGVADAGATESFTHDPQSRTEGRGAPVRLHALAEAQLQPAAVPVPAGNGIILARMSRRQLSELGMQLNVAPVAQKTEIHEAAQVALDDVTFKVPLSAPAAVTAATPNDTTALRDLAALGPVTFQPQKLEQLQSPDERAKAVHKLVDAPARPRPDAAREDPMTREGVTAPTPAPSAAPLARRAITPATAPTSALALQVPADPMDQPIEVLIVVQAADPANVPAPAAPALGAPAAAGAPPAAKETGDAKK